MSIAPGKTRVPAALLSLGLALLVAALYWPATGYDFVRYDDPSHLTENPLLREGMTREAVGKAFFSPPGKSLEVRFYIPLTWLSYMVDTELWGASPRGFHLTNILLHAANMALLLLLLWRMTGSVWRSALAASLVALHPLRVESVAWITERKDVLSLFFLLLALAAYLAWTRSGKKRWYASLCALFACSLLSKPMAVTFPLLLLLLDFWPLGRALPGRGARQWLPLLREKIPLLGLALPISLFTLVNAGIDTKKIMGGASFLLFHLEQGVASPLVYLRKTFWPSDLALRVDYLRPAVAWGDLLVGAGAILLITWLAWRARRERPWALFGWGWFLVALVPVTGALPMGSLPGIADRFTYLPHLGLMAALAWSAGSLSRKGKVSRFLVPAAAVLCLFALAGTTRAILPAWKDSVSVFSRAVTFHPGNPSLASNLGGALFRQGEFARASSLFRQVVRMQPQNPWGHHNLALSWEAQGAVEKAVMEYQEALRLAPEEGFIRFCYGRLLLSLDRAGEALPHLEWFLAHDPVFDSYSEGLALMGQALMAVGRNQEATDFLERDLKLWPRDLRARLPLAEILYARGKKEEAAAHWQLVMEDWPGTAEALFAQGRLRDLQGRKAEARSLYEKGRATPSALSGPRGLLDRIMRTDLP